MKNILYIFILLLTSQSCLNITDPEYQATYIESYNAFDKEMVDHFPKKIPNNCIKTSIGTPKNITEYNNNAILILEIQIASKEKFEEQKSFLKKEGKFITNSFDSCLLIVDTKESQNIINCDSFHPIPQETIFYYDDKNDKRLRLESCEIALLDYKPGIFIENEFLKAKETLPEIWKNGYSRGYAFNNKEQTIMYWLIIW